MAVDTENPAGDLFYRETLKALGSELAKFGGAVLRHERLATRVLDVTERMAAGVIELVDVNKDMRDIMRDLKDELVAARAERTVRPNGPIISSRTKTGG